MRNLFLFSCLFFCLAGMNALAAGNAKPLDYFLDDIPYADEVPSPEEFLGFQIGEWHLHHALLAQYMNLLAESSPRASIYEYGRSHEHRPLQHLVITSEENQQRLEEIRERHLQLTDPAVSGDLDISGMPLVVLLGYGVHGNEPSAHNAAPLVAYHLVAGQDDYIEEVLDNMVIIIDPSLNPDGQDRFASWVNRHRSKTLNPDPSNREFRDVWPGSRTNHYWFDLNRDWLPVVHPESRGRVKAYHQWKPNINTDHHEFGSNNTFFFQPGEPARVNHRTPQRTDDLTLEVARYHAAAFDAIGQPYYMQQGFDDFYYGKGSSYPDVQGSIGILFEQASSRGHRRETDHGILDFAQTIRNQVVVSFSTIEAGLNMRTTLLDHLRWFYRTALEESENKDFAAYIFGDPYDRGRNYHKLDILDHHEIKVYELTEPVELNGQRYEPGRAWLVPLEQPQYRLVQSVFETVHTFEDSLFYDVSTWTKPLAFNLPYTTIDSHRQLRSLLGEKVSQPERPSGALHGEKAGMAYVFDWDEFYAPKALYALQRKGLRTRVATSPFHMQAGGEKRAFHYGAVIVTLQSQEMPEADVHELVRNAAEYAGIDIYAAETSLVAEGIHLGSPSFRNLHKPRVIMPIGSGTNSREAGEVWHLLDQRFSMPVTKVELDRMTGVDLSRYNVMVMVSGSYNNLGERGVKALSDWIENGGTVVAFGSANRWLKQQELIEMTWVETPEVDDPVMLPYSSMRDIRGARRISGSIFNTHIDTTHPLFYGYRNGNLPIHVSGTLAVEPTDNPFANPMIFTEDALLSGYAWEGYKDLLDETAGVVVHRKGRGNVISLMHNPNFRGYWFGTGKMFMNSLFFGGMIR